MLGMMNCQTENYEFYASPPSSSAVQLRQDDAIGQQQSVGFNELFSSQKQKPQITYSGGRRLIDGKIEAESRQEPTKLWNRVIVDNLTARRLRPEPSNRKGDKEEKEMEKEEVEDKEEKEIEEKEEVENKEEKEMEEKEEVENKEEKEMEEKEEVEDKEEKEMEEKDEGARGTNKKQEHKSSFSDILSKLKPRKKQTIPKNNC